MNKNHHLIRHIRDETTFLLDYTKDVTYGEFRNNLPMKKAVVQSLQVIGEAANHITPEFAAQHPDIDWRGMAGVRNVLIHQYFEINYSIVWEILEADIPVLHEKITQLCRVCTDID